LKEFCSVLTTRYGSKQGARGTVASGTTIRSACLRPALASVLRSSSDYGPERSILSPFFAALLSRENLPTPVTQWVSCRRTTCRPMRKQVHSHAFQYFVCVMGTSPRCPSDRQMSLFLVVEAIAKARKINETRLFREDSPKPTSNHLRLAKTRAY
jgi:hypothetical protein